MTPTCTSRGTFLSCLLLSTQCQESKLQLIHLCSSSVHMCHRCIQQPFFQPTHRLASAADDMCTAMDPCVQTRTAWTVHAPGFCFQPSPQTCIQDVSYFPLVTHSADTQKSNGHRSALVNLYVLFDIIDGPSLPSCCLCNHKNMASCVLEQLPHAAQTPAVSQCPTSVYA